MLAILVRQFGDPEVMKLEQVDEPTPGPGELLVRARAIGVNPVETYVRTGNYASVTGMTLFNATPADRRRIHTRPGGRVPQRRAVAGDRPTLPARRGGGCAPGGGLFHPALIAHHNALLPEAPGRATAAFYVGFDLGIGGGSWLLGFALEVAGLSGLYWTAAALAVAVVPLARMLPPAGPRRASI